LEHTKTSPPPPLPPDALTSYGLPPSPHLSTPDFLPSNYPFPLAKFHVLCLGPFSPRYVASPPDGRFFISPLSSNTTFPVYIISSFSYSYFLFSSDLLPVQPVMFVLSVFGPDSRSFSGQVCFLFLYSVYTLHSLNAPRLFLAPPWMAGPPLR